MRLFLSLLGILLLLSCNSKEKQEVLDMKDILPSSERYQEGQNNDIEKIKQFYFDSLSTFAQLVSDTLGVKRPSVFVPDSVLFPDRFLCRSKEKWTGNNEFGEQLISVWTYNDSLETKNALFNWLDCFGKRCSSLQLFEERKVSNESFLLYATEKKMIYISSPNSLDAKTVIESLYQLIPRAKILYVLSQGVGRKAEWWEYVDKNWNIKKLKK